MPTKVPLSKIAKKPRANKHRPQELSTKRPVSSYRVAPGLETGGGGGSSKDGRDPRFDAMNASSFDEAKWRQGYAFLFERQKQEVQELKDKLKQSATAAKTLTRGGGAKRKRKRERILSAEEEEETRAELGRLQSQVRREEQQAAARQVKAAVHKEEVAAVKAGKAPYFHKKSAIKEKELMVKYEALEKQGQLSKFMAKRRQKLANKQHRALPARRGGEEWGGGGGGGEWGGGGGEWS